MWTWNVTSQLPYFIKSQKQNIHYYLCIQLHVDLQFLHNTCKRSESALERRIALYESGQQQQQRNFFTNEKALVKLFKVQKFFTPGNCVNTAFLPRTLIMSNYRQITLGSHSATAQLVKSSYFSSFTISTTIKMKKLKLYVPFLPWVRCVNSKKKYTKNNYII